MTAWSNDEIERAAKVVEHYDWLEKQFKSGEITASMFARANQYSDLLLDPIKNKMPIPGAATGPDGEMFFGWDKGRHHLELELIPDQPAEWFYRDRETEEIWGEDQNDGDPLPAKVLELMPLFYGEADS